MDRLVEFVAYIVFGTLGPIGLILLFIFFNKDKCDKWFATFGYALSKLGGVFKSAQKKAIQLDLQGSINDYCKKVSKVIPTLETEKVKVEYVDSNINRASFLTNNNVVLRLRRDDPNDLNFVHGAFLFVSTSLLFKLKRYLSLSQKDALDLYVTTRFIEKEKPNKVGYFLDEYLHPKLKDESSDRKNYFDQLARIDEGGLFYPVLLEELNCLGGKVFANRQDDLIITEVKDFFNFLEKVSLRTIGNDFSDLTFQKKYCKSAIVIIGKSTKILDGDIAPYTKFIRNNLYSNNIDTIYLLGNITNEEAINSVGIGVGDIYNKVRSQITKSKLHFKDGGTNSVDTYVVILQSKNKSIYIPE